MVILNISDDFESVCSDFNKTVTLRIGAADTVLSSVLSEPHETKELDPAGAQVTRSGTLFVWSMKRSPLPPIGSIIIDQDHGGVYWTIWKTVIKQHVDTYEAFCLNLNIVTADANHVTVLKAKYGHGSAGEAKATWEGLWSEVEGGSSPDYIPARFQPSEETARLEFGSEWSDITYRVYFEYPMPIDLAGGEYRLIDTEGNKYRVYKYFQENRIDRLPVAIAVKITEGRDA